MAAARSSEMFVSFRLHGVTFQNIIFRFAVCFRRDGGSHHSALEFPAVGEASP
jgi:hypothetical protein